MAMKTSGHKATKTGFKEKDLKAGAGMEVLPTKI